MRVVTRRAAESTFSRQELAKAARQNLMEGSLFKRGGGTSLFGRKNWKERYFVLGSDAALRYYDSEAAYKAKPESPLKMKAMSVKGAEAHRIEGDKLAGLPVGADPCQGFSIDTASGRTLLIMCGPAGSPKSSELWMRALKASGASAAGVAPPPPVRKPRPAAPPGDCGEPTGQPTAAQVAAAEAEADAKAAAEQEAAAALALEEASRQEAAAAAAAAASAMPDEPDKDEDEVPSPPPTPPAIAAPLLETSLDVQHGAASPEIEIDDDSEVESEAEAEASLALELSKMPEPPSERDDSDLMECSRANVEAIFRWVDMNNDGEIQVVEFTNAASGKHRVTMRKAGVSLSKRISYKIPGMVMQISDFNKLSLFQSLDADGNSSISLEEWVRAFENSRNREFQVWMTEILKQIRDMEGGYRPVQRV